MSDGARSEATRYTVARIVKTRPARMITVGALVLAAGDGAPLAAVAHDGTGGPVGLLAPGLALVGAGQGLCITPLTATVLSHTDPQRAGADRE